MDWPQHCAVVIPCHNEGAAIAGVVAAVRKILPTVLVVDDGSIDDTSTQARAAGAEVIPLALSQGKGAALRAGWSRARQLGFAWALCMDGDGQHAAADIPRFFQCAEETNASLVIGNRMRNVEAMPFFRRAVNRWMSGRISEMAGCEVPDSQCGFRLMQLAALYEARLSATHFEIESEQLLAFLAAGQRVEFVPVQVIYRSERSKIHPVRDAWRWFQWRRQWLASSAAREWEARRTQPEPLPR